MIAASVPGRSFRAVIVLASLLLSGSGVLLPLLMMNDAVTGTTPAPPGIWVWAAGVIYAWVAWAVMGLHWVVRQRLGRFWPISGGLAGVASLLVGFPVTLLATYPAVIMAGVFMVFHLRRPAA